MYYQNREFIMTVNLKKTSDIIRQVSKKILPVHVDFCVSKENFSKDDKVVGSFDYDSVSILENQAVRFGCDEMHFLKFMISRNKLCNPATVLQELSHMYVGE